jgi:histidyl-tRNA synthetase
MTGGTNTQSKLWQVGKVYRRDNPVMSKGRMREFSQAVCHILFSCARVQFAKTYCRTSTSVGFGIL